MTERLVSPAALVILSSKSYGTAPIAAIYAALLVLLLVAKPYKGSFKNLRPIANSIIVILVAIIFLAIAFMDDPEGLLALYGPLVVLALLFVCVVYSAYALIQDFR
jgi:peptidoglycan/LPS O-acetylase OafA/YrhL